MLLIRMFHHIFHGRKIVVIAHRDISNTTSTISSFDLLSGTHVPPHHIPERHVVVSVWTHGARLRFIIVNPGSSITVWESEFTSANPPSEIESFPTPNDFNFSAGSLFLPASFRLAFVLRKAVLIWDVRRFVLLLNEVGRSRPTGTSFSSDGRSFACGTTCREFRIWKESNTGYMPHRTLTSTSHTSILPLLSPDGESIITIGDRGIDLWLTADPTSSSSTSLSGSNDGTGFILEFSPDKRLAGVARLWDSVLTVLDLKSVEPRLIVDSAMKILGLGVTGSSIIVVDEGKVVTWDLPTGCRTSVARANINDSLRTTMLSYSTPEPHTPEPNAPGATPLEPCISISPNSHYIAIARQPVGNSTGLNIYDTSTGDYLTGVATQGLRPWFTPDGREVWCELTTGRVEGWSVVKDDESNSTKPEPQRGTAHPPGGFPWRSPSDYGVTSDWWVLAPSGKRLLWLPPSWRSLEGQRRWGGKIFGLLHRGLAEAVILMLDK